MATGCLIERKPRRSRCLNQNRCIARQEIGEGAFAVCKIQMNDQYVDITQLTKLIPLSKTVIEEQIQQGNLMEGVHFRRPTGARGKRVFFMSAIEKWLKGHDFDIRRDYIVSKSA